MKIVACLLVFISSLSCVYAQNAKYEQAAFDYFFTSVYEHKKNVKWGFSGLMEAANTQCFHLNAPCFKDSSGKKEDYTVSLALCNKLDSIASINNILPEPVNTESGKEYLRLKYRWLHRKWMMKLYPASEVLNRHYVMISLIHVYESTSLYLFELDDNGKVLRWCLRADTW
ncbi:hypothetical protein [Hymenobacter pini]|uniref:hypothetical protein n=1 Tax=Hymenobacter pini TaxID=2880879 RepID=UPI001CF5DCDA|nr:hypothetical protein [Hymenobacter pini]MCA8829782.1 hypothetical protein [Hymenobacter pini]